MKLLQNLFKRLYGHLLLSSSFVVAVLVAS